MAETSSLGQRQELTALEAAVRKNKSADCGRLTDATWAALSEVLLRRVAEPQTCLIRQGEHERRVFLVESGLLRVFRTGERDRLQLAVIGAGSLVGEGAFFAPIARNASVEVIDTAVVWELSPENFEALAEREPGHALAFTLYLGAVLSTRMLRPAARLSIT